MGDEHKCPYFDDHGQLLTRDQIEGVIEQTVRQTLVSMGVDIEDPIEMQRDFQSLREWRRTSEALRSKGMLTLVAIFTAGVVGALWVGLKDVFKAG